MTEINIYEKEHFKKFIKKIDIYKKKKVQIILVVDKINDLGNRQRNG